MKKIWLAAGLVGSMMLLQAAEFTPAEYLVLSKRLSPEVKMAVKQEGANYRIRVEAENPYAGVAGNLGVAAEKKVVIPLRSFPAEVVVTPEQIGGNGTLRLGLEVGWLNKDRSLRQREVFRAQALGNRLPADSRLWEVFDYPRYREQVTDRERQIRIPVEQPMDGKLTVVIEDQEGNRLRNLVSGIDYASGKHEIVWDGRDEQGNLVAPGEYRFRTLSHPGILPRFQMMFANGHEKFFLPWGSNHGTMTALADNAKYVFAAASITEGGFAIVALNPDGSFVRGYPQVGGAGIEEVFLAADDNRLYVVNDGGAWSGRGKNPAITLTVYDVETGNIVSPKGSRAQYSILHNGKPNPAKGQGAKPEKSERYFALRGAALCDGALYVGNADNEELMKIDVETGKVVDRIPVPTPKVLTSDGKLLYLVSGKQISTVDPAGKKVSPLFEVPFEPVGIALKQGKFFLTGAPDNTVKIYSRNGKLERSVGTPGGNYAGAWQPERLVNPVGVTLGPDGAMWIAENRRNPKRLSKWDLKSGKVVYDKVGSPAYGSPAAGFDSENPRHWVGFRMLWDIDQQAKTEKMLSVLQQTEGHIKGKIPECFNYKFVHQDGRTFLLGQGKATIISELMPDGTLRDLALISSAHQLLYALQWKRIPAYSDTFEKLYPKAKLEQKYADPTCREVGVLWVDKNGNGDFDADEFEFTPANSRFGSFGWGMRLHDLNLVVGYRTPEGVEKILTLKPEGFNQHGAPNYSLAKAIAEGKELKSELPRGSRTILDVSSNDSRGNLVTNTSPFMFSFDQNGKLNWLFQNRWTNVHGSHDAPLPRPGEFQGLLFSLGCAPLDKEGDVMIWIGNHGRLFLMTTDGMYVDEMFPDCRVAEVVGPGLVGGEPFGGNFEYDAVNKRYVLTAGTSGYRIYHLSGLDQVKRAAGTFKVTPEMIESAAREAAAAEQSDGVKLAVIPPKTDKKNINWGQVAPVAEWSSDRWSIQVRALYDQANLYLSYQVTDTSPWVNNGRDWTRLFKTGDTVDFQLGTDPAAKSDRKTATYGDIRLSIAPFEGKPLAVLYRYRLKDAAGANPVEFASPWRSEKVDDVRKLENVKVSIQRGGDFYRLDATIPLSDLGLTDPAGKTFRGDFGVVYGDRQGTINLSRFYWSNKATGLVNDVPGETMLSPDKWGEIKFGEWK